MRKWRKWWLRKKQMCYISIHVHLHNNHPLRSGIYALLNLKFLIKGNSQATVLRVNKPKNAQHARKKKREKKILSTDDSSKRYEIFIRNRDGNAPPGPLVLWWSMAVFPHAAQTLTMCRVLRSWTHSGAAGAAGEVPGGLEEAQPARGGTCAADGHLLAVSRYWRSDCVEERTHSQSS